MARFGSTDVRASLFKAVVATAPLLIVLALGVSAYPGLEGWVEPGAAGAERPAAVIPVGTEGGYASIQAAIDAAPAGAVLMIGPGTYHERLTISKPLVLRGAGWAQTTLMPPWPDDPSDLGDLVSRSLQDLVEVEVEGAGPNDAGDGEPEDPHSGATLLVENADGVVIEDLTIASIKRAERGDIIGTWVGVELRRARASVVRCRLIGGMGATVVIGPGSNVTVAACLVTGPGFAIAVGGEAGPARVRVVGSEIRNALFGVVISPQSDALVGGTRFAATTMVGIDYEDASPVIVGNVLIGSTASGIQARGATGGTIAFNVLCGMHEGVRLHDESRDRIVRNTFVADTTGVLAGPLAWGAVIERNVFAECETGFMWDLFDHGRETVDVSGAPEVAGNLFWDNRMHASRLSPAEDGITGVSEDIGLQDGLNREAEPPFRDAPAGDYSMAYEADAAGAPVGAPDHIGLASEWPTHPAERAYVEQWEAARAIQEARWAQQSEGPPG